MIVLEQQKDEVKNLKKTLFLEKKHGGTVLDEKKLQAVEDFSKNYKLFLDKCKTEREVVKESVAIAKSFGFTEFDHKVKYQPGQKVYYVNREKAVILAVIGKNTTADGARIAVAHIDSPRLDLKPSPLYESNEIALLKTHYYGGIKKYQWLAIPLALHGKIIKKSGESVDISVGEREDEPCFCITDLLPHLAKDQMKKTIAEGFSGEDLNALAGSLPFSNEEGKDLVKLNILKILNDKYGITETDFLSAELELVPAFKALDIGFDRSMIGAYGHDDRVCAYPALRAILECQNLENTAITVLVDKEEVGSDGNTGMNSAFFQYFIEDLAKQDNFEARHVLSKSKCLSTDVNAAFDPNFSSYYESENSCYINRGVAVTKYTGNGGKASTSDASAEFFGEIRKILDDNDIIWQAGEMGKVDKGGGGTIAKFIANLNIDVVDIGVPMFSMHAPFEIVSKIDVYMTYLAIKSFFEN
jgi:aspartyl aminopeptidase